LVAWVLAAAPVHAQLSQAERALEEADFAGAAASFDRAEASSALDRAELVRLFEGRATARFALGDEAGARADLRALGSLDSTHPFPPEAPPELRSQLRELVTVAGGALGLELRWSEVSGGSALSVEVLRDAAGLVRAVRMHTRVGVRGAWRTEEARSVVIPHPPGVRVFFHVEAIGPGGAVLLAEGSRARPLIESRAGGLAAEATTTPAEPREDEVLTPVVSVAALASSEGHETDQGGGDADLLVGLSIGGAVAVGAVLGVVLGVTLGAGSSVTQPSAPVVSF